jgi:hypothetical protein
MTILRQVAIVRGSENAASEWAGPCGRGFNLSTGRFRLLQARSKGTERETQ